MKKGEHILTKSVATREPRTHNLGQVKQRHSELV